MALRENRDKCPHHSSASASRSAEREPTAPSAQDQPALSWLLLPVLHRHPPTPQCSILLAGHNSRAIRCWSRARTGVSGWSQGAEQGQGSVGRARMNGGVKGWWISQLGSQACEREITLPKTPKRQNTNEATVTLRKPQGEATAGSHIGGMYS